MQGVWLCSYGSIPLQGGPPPLNELDCVLLTLRELHLCHAYMEIEVGR